MVLCLLHLSVPPKGGQPINECHMFETTKMLFKHTPQKLKVHSQMGTNFHHFKICLIFFTKAYLSFLIALTTLLNILSLTWVSERDRRSPLAPPLISNFALFCGFYSNKVWWPSFLFSSHLCPLFITYLDRLTNLPIFRRTLQT